MTAGRAGIWGEDEDLKLKNAVQMHGDKDWAKSRPDESFIVDMILAF
jgi:hypothetical protein